MSLDFKLFLDEFNRRFDELEIRWGQRFSSAAYIDLPPTPLSTNHSSDASASALPTLVAVIADNWGRCFDDGE
jgi:pentatricopeptide repeat protein